MENIKPGNIYRHYKGNSYKILAVARNSESPEVELIVYQGLYDCPKFGQNPIWARPIKMFTEKMIIDGKEVSRFTRI